jgi:hypothetical protein
MGNGVLTAILAASLLAVSAGACAQTAEQKGSRTPTVNPTPNLSGVWMGVGPLSRRGPFSPETDEADDFTYRHSPYPMQPWAAEKFAYNRDPNDPYRQGRNELNPTLTACAPPGPTVDWLYQATPFEIIQSPKRLLIIFEKNHEIRQIWTDGRSHPKDWGHNWMGHSIGHWEGDTLVADTIGLNDLTWLDKAGHVHSEELHLIERLQRVAPDKLALNITFDDPKTFTTAWSARKTFQLRSNLELEEEILCEDKFLGKTVPLR